jgi:phage gpG-like protein
MDRAIARFADGVSDFRPIWPVISDDFYALEKDQFKSEGAEGGEQWQELSEAYAGWKEVHYPGKPILQRSGDLYNSLTSANDPNAVMIAERRALTLGSKVPYAIYHQSPAPRKRLPRRPEIMITDKFRSDAMRNVQAMLVQMATNYGFRTGGLQPTAAAKLGSIFGKGIAPRGTSPRRGGDGGFIF